MQQLRGITRRCTRVCYVCDISTSLASLMIFSMVRHGPSSGKLGRYSSWDNMEATRQTLSSLTIRPERNIFTAIYFQSDRTTLEPNKRNDLWPNVTAVEMTSTASRRNAEFAIGPLTHSCNSPIAKPKPTSNACFCSLPR